MRVTLSTNAGAERMRSTSWEQMGANERRALREDLRRSPGERLARAFELSQFADALREAGKKLR